MSNKYKVVWQDNVYNVLEEETNQVIKQFLRKVDALKVSMFLNNGGGFDGWTPSFILKKFNSYK